jgi:Glutathione S-transferase, C-terminal domain
VRQFSKVLIDRYGWSVADLATFPWVLSGPFAGIGFDDFPKLKAWVDKILARDAIVEGLNVPEPNPMVDAMKDPAKLKKMLEDTQAMMVSSKKTD